MKYEDVIHAPVGRLKTAVTDWGELARRLETMATDARDGMQAKADRADWTGVNADVTRQFIRSTAREFADAAKAAKGIKLLLEDAHSSFEKARDELIRIRDKDGPEAGIRVDGHGKVTRAYPLENDPTARHDPDYATALAKEKSAADAWQRKIDQIVDNCSDADESLKLALAANSKEAHDFTAPTYTSLDQEEATRAARLFSEGSDISDTELAQLDELLLDNSGSMAFSKRFYQQFQPEKALTLYADLATYSSQYGEDNKKRLEGVRKLQRGLGLNLARASHDAEFTRQWGPALRKSGTQPLTQTQGTDPNDAPYGYQVLGGILRYGDYDPKFLNPIAEHVTQLHADDPDRFNPGHQSATYKTAFNPNGKNGAGYDPVNSVLEALGHSPQASKQFFSETPVLYNEDGSLAKNGESDLGGDIGGSYLNYFADEDYASFPDTDQSDSTAAKSADGQTSKALGHALESATLGHAWDDPKPLVRNEKAADLMDEVIGIYGHDAELLKRQEALSESLGRMSAGYMGDIDWAIDDREYTSIYAPKRDFDKHLSSDRDQVREFLSALGQHPDAYAAVSQAQQIYTTSLLEHPFDANNSDDKGYVRSAVAIGAEVQGHLDESRANQIEAEGVKKLEDFERAVAKQAAWTEFGVTATVATGTLLIPHNPAATGVTAFAVPLATDVGSEFINHCIGQIIGDGSEAEIDKKKEQIEELSHEEQTKVYRGGEQRAEAPLRDFMRRQGIDVRDDLGRTLLGDVDGGYGKGNDRAKQQGHDPVTE